MMRVRGLVSATQGQNQAAVAQSTPWGVSMMTGDYAAIAEGMGAVGITCNHVAELGSVIPLLVLLTPAVLPVDTRLSTPSCSLSVSFSCARSQMFSCVHGCMCCHQSTMRGTPLSHRPALEKAKVLNAAGTTCLIQVMANVEARRSNTFKQFDGVAKM